MLRFFGLAAVCFCSTIRASEPSLPAPHSNPVADGVSLERVYPRLRFDRPVHVTGADDGSGRLFVVEQAGIVRVVARGEEPGSAGVFLDITERVSRAGNEEGLIGFAFHPKFSSNGQVFVHYSAAGPEAMGILSRFSLMEGDDQRLDPSSEEILLRQPQPYRNHNGGTVAFGPEGYLYISFGDGGAANDPHANGQNLLTWLGSILRIDVDNPAGGVPYGIPEDNPFAGDPESALEEIYAFGFRNVWRFSFDRKTGQLWAGDVGQDLLEEVDVVEYGGNYGWRRFEATRVFDANAELTLEPAIDPVSTYGRTEGISITGGAVYRGQRYPALQGAYFYGDYASGNIWRVTPTAGGGYQTDFVCRSGRSIASFGEDDEGELLLCSFDGGIYRVVPSDGPMNSFSDWPETLSATGLFHYEDGRAQPAKHLIPYEVNAPFWSDRAEKGRWVELPEGSAMTYRADGAFDVPVGATLIKHFRGQHGRGMKDLETRLIKRTSEGWEAATYVGDNYSGQGSDAALTPDGLQFELWTRSDVQSWHAPSSSECATCHVDATGFPLGLRAAQLNLELANGINQLTALADAGHLRLPPGFKADQAPRFVDPESDQAPLAERSRVWLDVNCAMCHQPNGPGNASIDLRYQTPLANTGLVNQSPSQGDLGIQSALILAPGAAARSLLVHRIKTTGAGRMPPIGTNVVDDSAVALLTAWIESMQGE
ncbi:MAG: putative repeat protein (TIGR03806 family) [Candidatus Paceibacteria bacterium]|jgi:uncharacterized repeat protein (TIGR03806 family)